MDLPKLIERDAVVESGAADDFPVRDSRDPDVDVLVGRVEKTCRL